MPIYDYRCEKCNCKFDLLVKNVLTHSDKGVVCKKCGEKKCKRLLSPCFGTTSNAEPWEYDYTHKAKPKFVKDSKGQRHKFDPTKHSHGRKGLG